MPSQFSVNKDRAHQFIDLLAIHEPIVTRPLFGACALYRNDRVFAMVWQGSLYFKTDGNSRTDYQSADSHPLEYLSEGQPRALKSYWEVPANVMKDPQKLRKWAERAYQAALPRR
jgi:DNA transformation protein and related proteins